MSGKGTAVAGVGGLAIIVGLAALLGEFFFGPGGAGKGEGPGTGADQTQSTRQDAPPGDVRMADLPGRISPATAPTTQSATAGPLRIVIEGDRYLVDGRPLDLDAVRELLKAKAAAQNNALVEVVRQPNARAKAEEDLKAELEKLPLRVATD